MRYKTPEGKKILLFPSLFGFSWAWLKMCKLPEFSARALLAWLLVENCMFRCCYGLGRSIELEWAGCGRARQMMGTFVLALALCPWLRNSYCLFLASAIFYFSKTAWTCLNSQNYKDLGHLLLLLPVHWQGAGSEVEQPRCKSCLTTGAFTCYTAMLASRIIIIIF